MKKIFVFLLVTLMLYSCGAAKHNVTQKYISEISSYYQENLPEYSDDHSVFWNYILDNNVSFQGYLSDNSKFKMATSAKFLNEYGDSSLPFVPDDETLKEDEEFADYIVGTKYADKLKIISLYPEDEINAFAMPNGAIYLYGGMVDLIDEDEDMFLGVVAHEVAHVLFRHAERETFAEAKKDKSNNLFKGIATGLIATAGAVAIGASINNDTYSEDLQYSIADLTISSALIVNHEIDKYGLVKRFEYSREQEVEADLTALMFLEWLERDPTSYIELMRKMPQGDDDDDSEEYRTHPTMDFRIKSMKDFIGMPDRVFEVNNLKYTVLGWNADEFVAKYPDAVEIGENNRKAAKRANANRNVEFDDVYQ